MQKKPIPTNPLSAAAKLAVEVVPLIEAQDGLDFKVDGEVVPFRSLQIAPEVAGRIVFKSDRCRAGHFVKTGELLAEVDPTDYELEQRRRAESTTLAQNNILELETQIENSTDEIKLAQERLTINDRELARYLSTIKGVYSETEIDKIRSSVIANQETVKKLENQLRLFIAQRNRLQNSLEQERILLETAEINLKRTKILSPIDGIITSHSFEVDSYVQKGTNILTVQDTSRLEIQCSLQMKQAQWLWQNNDAQSEESGYLLSPAESTITYRLDGTDWLWKGRVTAYDGGGLNPVTRMMPCRVTVEMPLAVRSDDSGQSIAPPTLLSGMFVAVTIHAKPNIALYRVPEKAILPGNQIWTATGGVLKKHKIRVAATTPQGVLFYADKNELLPGDLIVVSPLASPQDGDAVGV